MPREKIVEIIKENPSAPTDSKIIMANSSSIVEEDKKVNSKELILLSKNSNKDKEIHENNSIYSIYIENDNTKKVSSPKDDPNVKSVKSKKRIDKEVVDSAKKITIEVVD